MASLALNDAMEMSQDVMVRLVGCGIIALGVAVYVVYRMGRGWLW